MQKFCQFWFAFFPHHEFIPLLNFAKSIITDEKRVPHYNQEIQKENEKFISHFITPFPIPVFNNIHSFFFISSFIYLFIVLFFIRLHFPLFIVSFTTGCGSLVNNSLISPGYPYPDSVQMECVYSVPIPYGKAMQIYFEDFDVGYHRWYGYK